MRKREMMETNLPPVIAIDGAAGTGKGTVRRIVAKALGFHELDSGLLFRAVGLLAREKGIPTDDLAGLAMLVDKLDIRFDDEAVWLEGKERGTLLRSDECGKLASRVAKIMTVRESLSLFQARIRAMPGLVTDGRDQAFTFRRCSAKFFLTADPEVRADRRASQFAKMGLPAHRWQILAEILRRDNEDRTRPEARFIAHPDAMVIDTTRMTENAVATVILEKFLKGDWKSPEKFLGDL